MFALKGSDGIALLDHWLKWARRSRIPSFIRLAAAITAHRAGIEAALTHGLSNARVESVNTKLRLLTRIAFAFRSPEALVALAMLDLGGLCPRFPAAPPPEPAQDAAEPHFRPNRSLSSRHLERGNDLGACRRRADDLDGVHGDVVDCLLGR